MHRSPPVALTIAGSDPSGGAGIQADLKTFHQFGVYGEAVITLLTVQNSVRVSRVEVMPPPLVLEQIAAVLEVTFHRRPLRRARSDRRKWRRQWLAPLVDSDFPWWSIQ